LDQTQNVSFNIDKSYPNHACIDQECMFYGNTNITFVPTRTERQMSLEGIIHVDYVKLKTNHLTD